jgi:hypothetical protein
VTLPYPHPSPMRVGPPLARYALFHSHNPPPIRNTNVRIPPPPFSNRLHPPLYIKKIPKACKGGGLPTRYCDPVRQHLARRVANVR